MHDLMRAAVPRGGCEGQVVGVTVAAAVIVEDGKVGDTERIQRSAKARVNTRQIVGREEHENIGRIAVSHAGR